DGRARTPARPGALLPRQPAGDRGRRRDRALCPQRQGRLDARAEAEGGRPGGGEPGARRRLQGLAGRLRRRQRRTKRTIISTMLSRRERSAAGDAMSRPKIRPKVCWFETLKKHSAE